MAGALARSSFMTDEFTVDFLLVNLSLDLVPICGRLDLFQKGKDHFFPSKRGLGADPVPAALVNVSGNAGREPARH